jgi:hypothetical protein
MKYITDYIDVYKLLQILVDMFGASAEDRFAFIFSRSSIDLTDDDTVTFKSFCEQLVVEERYRASKQLSCKEKAILYEALRATGEYQEKVGLI